MSYDTTDFQKDVIERSASIPVLVDFWAEWCAPCRMLGPVLERVAEKHKGEFQLVKFNTEQFPYIAAQYGVRSIPNVKLFVDGKVADEFVGALPEHMIEVWLKKALPGKYHESLQEAKRLLSEDKIPAAQALLQQVVDGEPGNQEARILLAQTLIFAEPQRAAALVQGIEADSEFYDLAEAIRTFSKLLEYRTHPERLAEAPVKLRYLAAIERLAAGNFDAALAEFIEVMASDRSFDDDGARKACIAIFKYLGEEHELTRKYRAEFSRALYV